MPPTRRQVGFSLVELMVAMVLGLLITAALITLYVNTSKNNSELAKENSQIENGRYSIQLLENDISHAGYWGGYVPTYDDLTYSTVPTDAPSGVPDPCQAYSTWTAADITNLLDIPLQVYPTASSAGTCSSTGVISNQVSGTDVVVVRHADTCLAGASACAAKTASVLYFQPSFCYSYTTNGCSTADTVPYVLAQYPSGTCDSACETAVFSMHKNGVGTPLPEADLRKYVSNIYYIRNYSVSPGDGIPTLVRSSFDFSSSGTLAQQAETSLIEGIQGFHVELGIDSLSRTGAAVDTNTINWVINNATTPPSYTMPTNRGDGVADSYVSCTTASPCTAAQLMNAVSVRLYILARSSTASAGYTDTKTYTLGSVTMGPFNDHYKRHVFSTTIRLTNISGRRETP